MQKWKLTCSHHPWYLLANKYMKPPEKRPKKRPKTWEMTQNGPKSQKNGLFFEPFSKKFWFFDQIIYLYFSYMFWNFFPSCKKFGSKVVWGRCAEGNTFKISFWDCLAGIALVLNGVKKVGLEGGWPGGFRRAKMLLLKVWTKDKYWPIKVKDELSS